MQGHGVGRGFVLGDMLSKALNQFLLPPGMYENFRQPPPPPLRAGAQVQRKPFQLSGVLPLAEAGQEYLVPLRCPSRVIPACPESLAPSATVFPRDGSIGRMWSQETRMGPQESVCVERSRGRAGSPTSKWALGAAGG